MAWPRLVEASGQPKQVKVSNRLGPWNLLPGSSGSPDLLDPSGLGVCGRAPVVHGPHCSTASRARYHTHLRCAVGTPRVRKAPQAHLAFYYSEHKQRDTSLAMWIPHPISHTPVLLGLLLPLLPMADQARLQRHPIKPARRVRQQHPRRVKLGHAAQIEDQDARRLDDRVQTVSVVHDQERACARMGKEKTYAIVRMVTSSKRGPRMISWIARSVSKSTADVAVSVASAPPCRQRRTRKLTFIEHEHLGLSQRARQRRALMEPQATLTFLNNARAKHNSCLCPADNDEPPSCTGASRPSGRLSTYVFKWA